MLLVLDAANTQITSFILIQHFGAMFICLFLETEDSLYLNTQEYRKKDELFLQKIKFDQKGDHLSKIPW